MQSVMPGYVASKMTSIKKPSLFIPSCEDYANSAVNTIGIDSTTFGYWTHLLMMTLYQALNTISRPLFVKLLRTFAVKRKSIKKKIFASENRQ